MRPRHALATLVATTLLGAGAAGAIAASPPPGTAACPTSLHSVPGGARDASTLGLDDGVAGPEEAYRPGEMLVQLDRGTNAAEFACVLRQLGAVKLAGGRGRAGLAGIPDLMLVQLPAARSVIATSRELLAPRYRKLMETAQPNWIAQEAAAKPPCPDPAADPDPETLPNDTYFPLQWGLGPGNEAAQTHQTIAAGAAADNDTPCASVAKWPGKVENNTTLKVGDAVATMRLPQVWPLTKRWYWFKRQAKIGIIDDSLVQHPDLEGSVVPGGSRVVKAATITVQRLKVKARQGTFTITTGGGDVSCPIPYDAAAEDIKAALNRHLAVMCGVPASANPAPEFAVMEARANRGTMELTIGGDSVVLNGADLGEGNTDAIRTAMETNAGLKAQLDSGSLDVRPLASSDPCSTNDSCTRWLIARKGPLAGLTTTNRLIRVSGIVTLPGRVKLELSRYSVKPGTEPRTFSARLKGQMVDSIRWNFTPADAAKVESADAQGYAASLPDAPASGTWPGWADRDTTATHGQLIAGIIGAQANNGRGIAGVLGPYIKPRLMTAVTSRDAAADLVAIKYLAGDKGVPVVNYSRGTSIPLDKITDVGMRNQYAQAMTDPQNEDPRPKDLLQEEMSQYPGTLFVVAAGNSSSSLNDLSPRASQKAAYGPCAPKGMGITNPPGRSQDGRDDQAKGGALSMLRMPDGTFDRGNILCVASLAPPMQETAIPDEFLKTEKLRLLYMSEFSSWGAGIVDVAAPGEAIIGTTLGDAYLAEDGTSFAAPLVAGVAGIINAMYPGIDPSLVKCAILSSATTAPLSTGSWVRTSQPYSGYNFAGNDWAAKDVLTVPGMVVATEALSAAASLRNRTSGLFAGRRVNRGEGPTCVQERDAAGPAPRWVDTATKPVPQPPAPQPPAGP